MFGRFRGRADFVQRLDQTCCRCDSREWLIRAGMALFTPMEGMAPTATCLQVPVVSLLVRRLWVYRGRDYVWCHRHSTTHSKEGSERFSYLYRPSAGHSTNLGKVLQLVTRAHDTRHLSGRLDEPSTEEKSILKVNNELDAYGRL